MKIRYLAVVFFISVVVASCNYNATEQKPETAVLNASESYRPYVFKNNNRAEQIKSVSNEINKLFEEDANAKNIPGVAWGIIVDDQLVVASSAGLINLDENLPATTKSNFRIASMSKSFTAMAILKLRDEGKLSLDDPAAIYISGMKKLKYLTGDATVIKVEDLLTMSAGFPEDNPWGDRQLDEPDQMLMKMVNEGISFSNIPSYTYEYSNTGYALLGNIISRVSGMPYQQYIRKNIFEPLQMEDTYWEYDSITGDRLVHGYRWEDGQWKLEPMLHDGAFGSMGGIITTIEDFSKYVGFHLSAWPPRSTTDSGPVKRSTLREMHRIRIPWLNTNNKDWNGDSCPSVEGYGYGLRIHKNCKGIYRISHGGALPGFGSNYVFYPEYGIGIMMFGNLTYTWAWPLAEIEKLLFETLDLQSRQLPVSDILKKRKEQVAQLIQSWDKGLEAEILAENFYPDKSREHRMAEIKKVLDKAGHIKTINEMKPVNQLRGSFTMNAENGEIAVFFTLNPEANAKVQDLEVNFRPKR